MRVLIVADDPLTRAGIAALLADQPSVVVAGSTGSDDGLIAAVAAFAPDVLVWDLGWETAAASDALSHFCDDHDLPVVAMTMASSSASLG